MAAQYPTRRRVLVRIEGAQRDRDAILGLLRSVFEEVNSGRWGEPSGETGTMLEVQERASGSGSSVRATWLRLELVRHGPAAGDHDVDVVAS